MTTTTEAGTGTLHWDAPGKGDWRGLHDHFPRALTPEYQRLLALGMTEGEAVWIAAYGLPVRTIEPRFVHGRVFISPTPLVGPATDRFPPAWAMALAIRVVPAFRRRARAARAALAERPWLDEAERWFDDERAGFLEAGARLEAVDPAALDDAALDDHLRDLRAHAEHGYRTHFRLHGPDLIPTGLLLARAIEWGIDPIAATALLTGCSPASRGDGELPAWRLVTGYDLDERCAAELPTHAVAPRAVPAAVDVDTVRDRVPGADREEFDRLLADARATYGLRDDNGLLTAAWPVGLLRRGMLESGRRLLAAGRLLDREHAVELTVDELVAGSVSADAAAARAAERRRLSGHAAPARLGVETNLPFAALPPAMRAVTTALMTLGDLAITPAGEREALVGVGIGVEAVVGRACVAADPAVALARFEPGDIVVTAGTCPAWNSILALAGGVVTEEGGPLSHAAIIARELGLPALIGAAHAMAHVPDGATVELDPVEGRVRVLPRA